MTPASVCSWLCKTQRSALRRSQLCSAWRAAPRGKLPLLRPQFPVFHGLCPCRTSGVCDCLPSHLPLCFPAALWAPSECVCTALWARGISPKRNCEGLGGTSRGGHRKHLHGSQHGPLRLCRPKRCFLGRAPEPSSLPWTSLLVLP